MSSDGQLSGTGKLQLQAGGDATLKGSLRSNGDLTADAGGKLALLGSASATTGALNLTSVGDLSIGKDATAQAGGAIGLRTQQRHHRRRDGVAASADHQRGGRCPSTASCWRAVRCPSMRSARSRPRGREAAGQGALRLDAGKALTLAGLAETNAGMTLASGTDLRGRQRHGLWRRAVVTAGQGLTLGATGNLQASGLLQAQAGGKLQADGTISGEQDIRLSSKADTVVNGKTVANGLLNIKAGTDLSVGKNGLAQGSGNLFLFAGQDLRIAGTAGTAETAAARRHAARRGRRDIFVTGTVTASSPASLSAQRHGGRHRHRAERRSDHASRRRPEGGRERALAVLGQAGRQGRRRYRLGRHAGGRRRIGAGGHGRCAAGRHHCRAGRKRRRQRNRQDAGAPASPRPVGVQDNPMQAGGRTSSVPASGDLSVSGGRDLTIKQGSQVQAAGA